MFGLRTDGSALDATIVQTIRSWDLAVPTKARPLLRLQPRPRLQTEWLTHPHGVSNHGAPSHSAPSHRVPSHQSGKKQNQQPFINPFGRSVQDPTTHQIHCQMVR